MARNVEGLLHPTAGDTCVETHAAAPHEMFHGNDRMVIECTNQTGRHANHLSSENETAMKEGEDKIDRLDSYTQEDIGTEGNDNGSA